MFVLPEHKGKLDNHFTVPKLKTSFHYAHDCVPLARNCLYVLFTVQVVTSHLAEPRPMIVINALHQYTRMRMNIATVMVCHTSACLCTRLL